MPCPLVKCTGDAVILMASLVRAFISEVIIAVTLSRPDRHHTREQVLGVGGG